MTWGKNKTAFKKKKLGVLQGLLAELQRRFNCVEVKVSSFFSLEPGILCFMHGTFFFKLQTSQ